MPVYFGSNRLKLDGISKAYYGSQLVYSSSDAGTYLIFSSSNPFTVGFSLQLKTWDGTLEYSTDTEDKKNWTEITDPTITLSSNSINELYLRGLNNTHITTNTLDPWSPQIFQPLTITGNGVAVTGNIENLLDYEAVKNNQHPTMTNYCFAYMFENCTALYSGPDLYAETLTDYCYYSMFNGCTYLHATPLIAALQMATSCCEKMFYGCTNLTVATRLSHIWYLAHACFVSMFHSCTSLTTPPALPITSMANLCYADMFGNCTSLTTAPALPVTELADYCYEHMFDGCVSLTVAPKLPATTLARFCYQSMFDHCVSLTTIPELPATALAEFCYRGMFGYCTGVKLSTTQDSTYINEYRIPITGTGIDANNALTDMFLGTNGSFTGTPLINTTYYTGNTIIS